jgi:hypothetical protein
MRVAIGLAALTLAGGAGVVALAPPPPPAAPPQLVRTTYDRVWFAAGHPALLTLPDGRTRAVSSMLNTRSALRYGEYRWDDRDIPPGKPWVRVDLKEQIISVFRGAHEIGTAVILYGTDGKPTPLGTFPIKAKAVAYRSRTYDADMPYMLRLTDDGVAIHASAVRYGSATHGCIGVPEAFASRLFAEMKAGDPVSILAGTDDRLTPAA